jgi:uncharacterized membrane protein
MRKEEFLKGLDKRLYGLNKKDKKDILSYYQELIEDKVDNESISEEEIINNLGSLDDIAKKVNPNFKANEEITNPVVKVVYGIIVFGIAIGTISLLAALVGIAVATIFMLVCGISAIATEFYSALIWLGCSVILLGGLLIAVPASIKLVKFIKDSIKYLMIWLNNKLG